MRRLVLFAKRPRRGRVKTRLRPPLTADEALGLYRAFLHDQVRFLRGFAGHCDLELRLDGPLRPGERLCPDGVRVVVQGPGDLGRRLLRAFRGARRDGAAATVVIGADAPTLPAGLVREAFAALEGGAAATVAPAADGGYVLIGMRRPWPALFHRVPWGGPRVFAVTLARARQIEISLRQLAGWYDVDDAGTLRRLQAELRQPTARRRAPATARYLRGLDRAGRSVV
jgi:rSAM/selenodomain-associated transferase 1